MKSVVRSVVAVACVGVGIVAVTACSRNNRTDHSTGTDKTQETHPAAEGKGTTTVTGANVTSNPSALDRIVTARCAREATCNNIGTDKKYANTQACAQKLKADLHDDLNAKDCPNGVDQHKLDKCLEEVRTEECGSPVDVISRVAACRKGELCIHH